jgi:hypothetical protein
MINAIHRACPTRLAARVRVRRQSQAPNSSFFRRHRQPWRTPCHKWHVCGNECCYCESLESRATESNPRGVRARMALRGLHGSTARVAEARANVWSSGFLDESGRERLSGSSSLPAANGRFFQALFRVKLRHHKLGSVQEPNITLLRHSCCCPLFAYGTSKSSSNVLPRHSKLAADLG